MKKVLLIGCGHMGSALLTSWLDSKKYHITIIDPLKYTEHFGYTVIPRLKSEFIETIVENETPAGPGGTQRGATLGSFQYLQGPSQYGNINKVITGGLGPDKRKASGDNVAMVTEQITDEMTFVLFDINRPRCEINGKAYSALLAGRFVGQDSIDAWIKWYKPVTFPTPPLPIVDSCHVFLVKPKR